MIYENIRRVIYGSSMLLDAEDFKGFLKKCGENFNYRISAYSPEIGKEMIWLNHDRSGLKGMISMLPKHVRMKGTFKRHVSVYEIEQNEDKVKALSSVLLIYTDPNGASKLFASGQYRDVLDISTGEPQLVNREVRLDTRELGAGLHIIV